MSLLLPSIKRSETKFAITVAGESGSGKSETASAIADCLKNAGIAAIIFQQDDYFIHPLSRMMQLEGKTSNGWAPER